MPYDDAEKITNYAEIFGEKMRTNASIKPKTH